MVHYPWYIQENMASKKCFYLTTTLPYVNAEPHIGFGLEIVEGDVISRYQRLLGKEVVFNTGTDEHGQKIYQKAAEAGVSPQAYVDKYAAQFHELKEQLNLSYTHFIRTTDEKHKAAAQEFWRRCDANGDIYKKQYSVKYCVGCELEKTESELVDGRCPLHPDRELELRNEENYFFRFSRFQEPLLELYRSQPEFVQPAEKMKEIISFVEGGLQDFSISRLKEKMPWGISVPGDDEHVMYVWFDALVNYVSTLGWPNEAGEFARFWPGIQLAGKDNLRQQSAMWQAMLFSAHLPSSQKILINGFISIGGQKMSKSLGNVIAPRELTARYGIDGARYALLALGGFGSDMDVTWDRLDTQYTADLSNGLGNLCSRVAKMAENLQLPGATLPAAFSPEYRTALESYDLTAGLKWCMELVAQTDAWLSETTPWKKEGVEQRALLEEAVSRIVVVAFHLQPYLPETAQKIIGHFTAAKISALSPLFPRLE